MRLRISQLAARLRFGESGLVRAIIVVVACLGGVVACGDNTNGLAPDGSSIGGDAGHADAPASHDAAPHDAGMVAMVDAPADAPDAAGPPPTGPLIAYDASGPLTSWSMAEVYSSGTSTSGLFIYNAGAVATGALAASITGADAADFTLLGPGTTCGPALVPGDGCWLYLKFAPGAGSPATHTATLVVDGAASPLELPLTGRIVAQPTTPVVPAMPVLDLGIGPGTGTGTTAAITITNTSSATLTPGIITSSGAPFSLAGGNCTATFAPGASCQLYVQYAPFVPPGFYTGTVTIAFDGQPSTVIAVRGSGLRTVTTELSSSDGVADGKPNTITSLPQGINCGSACSGSFVDQIPIYLTATAASGDEFQSWHNSCFGNQSTCVIPATQTYGGDAVAYFGSAGAPTLEIDFAGSGTGLVEVSGGSGYVAYCTSSCVVTPPAGDVQVDAATPSTFAGFTGGTCSGSAASCDLGALAANGLITATFDRNPYEVAFLPQPMGPYAATAIAASGDLVIGNDETLADVTLDGQTMWSTALTDFVNSIAVDADGDIFVACRNSISELSGSGVQSGVSGAMAWPGRRARR